MIRLSEAEIYIMHIIWQNNGATSFDILRDVKREKKLSEFTVRTLLARMVKKKAIYVADKYGKTYYYKPLIEKNEYLRKEGNTFLDSVYKGAVQNMMLNFVKDKRISKVDAEFLIKKIEENDAEEIDDYIKDEEKD